MRLRDQGGSWGRSRTQDQKTRTVSTCWSNPGGISLKRGRKQKVPKVVRRGCKRPCGPRRRKKKLLHRCKLGCRRFPLFYLSTCLPSGESHRPLTLILLKSIAIRLPFLSRCFCKSMPFSWQRVVYTPPICIAIRLPFVSRYFCRSIRVRGRWNTPNTKCFGLQVPYHNLKGEILKGW